MCTATSNNNLNIFSCYLGFPSPMLRPVVRRMGSRRLRGGTTAQTVVVMRNFRLVGIGTLLAGEPLQTYITKYFIVPKTSILFEIKLFFLTCTSVHYRPRSQFFIDQTQYAYSPLPIMSGEFATSIFFCIYRVFFPGVLNSLNYLIT